ncbi:hypothetical protein [Mucisphaera calidilacus]|uniref:Uncharacterized protein n=1 Tax=Mucisphaera calidilacus TaxID=2527982 RepID=A0A518BTY9_9BACT|nr:hypothetical protein [Mucisphaera calidilacus]QDU70443.1 hypothetical protein Pan265_02700 [Mucisphaera calidilacus]
MNLKVLALAGCCSVLSFLQSAQAQYTPPDLSSLDTVITPSDLAMGALALGGVAIGAAFALGGGFRIAKKTYNWIFAKM